MELFKQVPSNFFSVLASPNKEIYLKALLTLYQAFQSDWSIPRSELTIFLIDQLDDLMMGYDLEDGEADEVTDRTSSGFAHLVIRKLKETGWVEIEMGADDFNEYISIPDFAYRIIEVLHEIISDSKDTEYNRYVYSTYSVLRLSSEEGSDYKTAINSAYEQTRNLFDKLKMLHNNIRRYHRQLAELHDMNQILTEHFNEFKENLADKIYYPIKTFDSIHRFKTPILSYLKEWLHSDEIMAILSEEEWLRERSKKSKSEYQIKEEAIEDAKMKLVKTMDIYENMDQLLREIDKKNTEYTKATLDRMDFLLNTDRSVKGKVRELIKVLSSDATGKWHGRISSALDISTQSIVDEGSLYTSRNARKVRDTKREKIRLLGDMDGILHEAKSFKDSVQDSLNRQMVQQYMLDLLDKAETVEARDIPIENDRTYVKTILGVLESDDRKSKYRVTFKEGEVDKERYVIPDFTVKRKVENDK